MSKRILVVDDDDSLRELLAADFRRKGFEVTEARDGAEALRKVPLVKPDLIISDVRMPTVDGVQLLDQVRATNPEMPVFMFITGFSELTIEDAYQKGAAALFPKPFRRKTLFDAVNWALLPRDERWKKTGPRLATDFEIDLEAQGAHGQLKGQMLNIGHGGMFVGLASGFPDVGAQVDFVIHLAQGNPTSLAGTGIVRHVRIDAGVGLPTGCGIEFTKFADSSLPEALRLIRALRPVPFIPKA